jgi:hypothetical protein
MTKLGKFLTLMLLALLSSLPASAQSAAGEQELAFSASLFDFTEGDTDPILILNARYARFLTDHWQLGGGVAIGGPIDDLDRQTQFELFGAYFFSPAEERTWYLRGGYFANFDNPGDGFVELAGGFRAYLSEKTAFFWEASYGEAVFGDGDGGVVRSVAGLVYAF